MKTFGWALLAILFIVIVYEYSPKIGYSLIVLAILGMVAAYNWPPINNQKAKANE